MDCLELDTIKIHPLSNCINAFSSVLHDTKITTSLYETLTVEAGFLTILEILMYCRNQNGAIFIVGNGGSAAIASHAVIDFINMAKMQASAMLDPAVTTCLSNDYGYEYVYARQLAQCIQDKDILIAISSSGNSKNIINAVNIAKQRDARVITFTGFSGNNSLRQMGDYNLWLNSTDYGQVEIGHAFMLHYLTDCLKENINCSVSCD